MMIVFIPILCASVRAQDAKPKLIVIHAENEPVRAVLTRLARDAGVNITIGPGVGGYVTIALRQVSITEALNAILSPLGDTFKLHGHVYDIEAGAGSNNSGGVTPVVIQVTTISVHQAASQIRSLFPQATVREDARSNAIVVIASPPDTQAIRTTLSALDTKSPLEPVTEAVSLRIVRSMEIVQHLRTTFPRAKIEPISMRQLLITARPADLTQIKAAIGALDSPESTPPPQVSAVDAVRISQRSPRDVALALERQIPGLRASVSGSAVVLTGPPDVVARARTLITQIDIPPPDARFTQVYRVRTVDAGSVADLLRRSFPGIDVTVDSSINAIAVTAVGTIQMRISDALTQLDPAPGSAGSSFGSMSSSGSVQVITLKSYVPGQSGSSIDAVGSITQAIQIIAPDVRVLQLPTPGQIALVGPPASVRNARDFINTVDTVPPLVVLDTEILEIDETVAKNLGLELGTTTISTTYTEATPPPNVNGVSPGNQGLRAFTRTPLSFTAQLNLLVQVGKGRVLADPRITTLSGRTASIRAGDTISILTTTSGNAGTIASTQVQSFQTGVTLDITPSVTPDGDIMVNLHPVVNSLIGTNNGVPEISTRDTQTTVHLRDNEMLVIGGLIQENDTRTTTKVPFLGDLPLVGALFRNENIDNQRNELVIVVTPHVIKPGDNLFPGPQLHELPRPEALPTLPPDTQLPAHSMSATATYPMAAKSPTAALPTLTPTTPPTRGPVPAPGPTAFDQTNVFTFGSAPQTNFAQPTDPVQIFYATLSPTIVSNGTSVQVSAITSSNANSVKLVIGTQTITLSQRGVGQWQATFPFPLGAVTTASSPVLLSLQANRSDGTSATIPIPINIGTPNR